MRVSLCMSKRVTALHSRQCENCDDTFETPRAAQRFCNVMKSWICEICNEGFDKSCKTKIPRACGKSCGSKLIRKEQGLRNMTPCVLCGDPFPAVITGAIFCNKTITVDCKGCDGKFERFCNQHRGSYCTTSCRNSYMRKELYEIKESRICIICRKDFKPSGSAQFACGSHEVECEVCDETFKVSTQQSTSAHLGKYCGNVCSTLAQFDSKLSKELIKEYKNPNDWAVRFKKSNGRKPTMNDFRVYFNINSFPQNTVDSSLFRKTKDSRFEIIVESFLKEQLPEIEVKRHVRNIYLDDSPFAKEIDLVIEDLLLGFEVQDFATHSKDSDVEPSQFQFARDRNLLKRGPINHEAKRTAAKTQLGIILVDIWEDEIKDGRYKEIILNSITTAQQSILVK